MCAADIYLESESQNDDDDEQSTKVDKMIDVVYEDKTDDEANFFLYTGALNVWYASKYKI